MAGSESFFDKIMDGKTLATPLFRPSVIQLKRDFTAYKSMFYGDKPGIKLHLDVVELADYNESSLAFEVVRLCD